MKIAQLSSHYRPVIGGQEVYIKNLNAILMKAGHETTVYQLDRGEKAEDNVCFPKIPYVAKFITEFETRWLSKLISLTKPKGLFSADVLIGHYASLAKPLASVAEKTIVLSHGVEWKTENQRPYDRFREANAKWCLDRFPHVVNDTHYLRYLGIDAEPAKGYFTEVSPGIWFIPNCVDTEHFSPGEGMAEFKGKKMILVPRQMVLDRGIHLAIEAFALLADRDSEVEMCLLGKRWRGAGKYLATLDGLIEKYGLQDRVYFRDSVPNTEMPLWYRSACMTLIPTLRREGTSLSAIESMSCGTSTVSTNVVGLADLPTVQCEPNAESVAQAMEDTIKNREEIATKQRQRVCEELNFSNWASCWSSVINSVSSNSRR